MTWREFRLRVIGWEREERVRWMHTRILSYQIYLSIDEGKTKKRSIDKFWPLDKSESSKDIEHRKQLLIEANKRAYAEATKLK